MCPPRREAADRRHQLPAVRAAGRGGEPDLQGHRFPPALCPLERQRDGESWGGCWVSDGLRRGLLVASGAESFAARQAHEYVENQHIASNLTVRVNHDLLRAGAMCRVSNALGTIEQHIQLLGECRALPAAAGARRSGGAPGPGAACRAVRCRRRGAELSLSLHSCPTSGVRQERSVWRRAGCAPARLLALGLRLPLRSLPSHQGN